MVVSPGAQVAAAALPQKPCTPPKLFGFSSKGSVVGGSVVLVGELYCYNLLTDMGARPTESGSGFCSDSVILRLILEALEEASCEMMVVWCARAPPREAGMREQKSKMHNLNNLTQAFY